MEPAGWVATLCAGASDLNTKWERAEDLGEPLSPTGAASSWDSPPLSMVAPLEHWLRCVHQSEEDHHPPAASAPPPLHPLLVAALLG